MQLKGRVLAAVRGKALWIFLPVALTGIAAMGWHIHQTSAATVNDYSFATDFSSVQGQNQWYYMQWNGSAYSNMTWSTVNNRWQGSCEFCLITSEGAHPDSNDSVIAWKAPKAGSITVQGTMDSRILNPDADGIRTVIKKKSGSVVSQVWPSTGYQEIKPNFMAQHIFKTTVATGDMLYFHVNKNVNTYYDMLNWQPTISYVAEPKFTLDRAEVVMGPTDFQKIGVATAMDASLSVMPNGSKFDFYHSSDYGTLTQKFTGTLAQPAQTSIYNKFPFTNPHNIPGDWWISNMYKTPDGKLLALCHIEQADAATTGRWAIGLAYSTDNGASFQKLGNIIALQDKTADTNIFGVPFVIKDGYMYAYYGEPWAAVARAPLSEVLAAAANGTVSPWKKYYAGGWEQNGINGLADGVIPYSPTNDYSTHGDAAYSTYLGKYLLSGNTGIPGSGKGVFLTFSDDAVSYEVPGWIQKSSDPNKDSLSPYQTIVNIDGSDNGVVGQSFYVYYGYFFKPGDISTYRWAYRQKVTLNKAGFANATYNATTDFSSTQGNSQWSYYQYSGAKYTPLTWDAVNSRWKGTTPFLIISANDQHADGGDSARAWVAPRDGVVRVATDTGNISVTTGANADGVKVKLLKNAANIWPATGTKLIGPGTAVAFPPVDIPVIRGDTLYFQVNQNVTTAFDTTHWVPTITYK